MASVVRLVTAVDVRHDGEDSGTPTLSVSARLDALLDDGRRIVLLDDRGWTSQVCVAWDHEPSLEERERAARLGAWFGQTVEEIEETARQVVGPDEAFGDHTQEDMAAAHWEALSGVLRALGVEAEAAGLRALPHDVELGERVLARIAGASRERQD
jgi:hypothetical protein